MAIGPLPSHSPAGGVSGMSEIAGVSEVLRALDSLAALDLSRLPGQRQAQLLRDLGRVEARVSEFKYRVMAAARRSKTGERSGATDTSAWVSSVTRTDGAKAAREVTLATGLEDHEATRQALAEGVVSAEHAEVIVTAAKRLPESLTQVERRRVERHLIGRATEMTPGALRRRARRAIEALEHDTQIVDAHENTVVQSEEDRAKGLTRLTWHHNHDGTVTGRFVVPLYYGEVLRKVVNTMTAPRRINRREGPGKLNRAAGTHAGTDTGNDAEVDVVGRDVGVRPDDASAGRDVGLQSDGASAMQDTREIAALGPGADRVAAAQRRDWAHEHGLALCELIEHLPTDRLHHKSAATLLVTLDEEVLRARLAVAGLETGEAVSAAKARHLACTSGIVPAVMGGESQVLDLGRTTRTFTDTHRTALAKTHSTCAAAGCQRPYAWCELHHLVPWKDGGTTDLKNAVPLCHWHHRLIDHPSYSPTRGPNGKITFTRRN